MPKYKTLYKNMYKLEPPKMKVGIINKTNAQIKRKKTFLNNINYDKKVSDLNDDLQIDKINIRKWNHLSKVNQTMQKTNLIKLQNDKKNYKSHIEKESLCFSRIYKGQKVFSVYIAQHNVGEIFTIGNDIRCIMSENIKLHSYKTSDLFGTRIKANVRNINNPLFHVFPVVLEKYYNRDNSENTRFNKVSDFKRSPLVLKVKRAQIPGEILNYSGRKFHSTNYWVNFDSQ
mmetsp:Transcript_4391/g.6995  ORF Transcript_4391/g.6995 Transcript_4391/m.6995 type:complete len:230 (-) Transcript_4391:1166-1855(-)